MSKPQCPQCLSFNVKTNRSRTVFCSDCHISTTRAGHRERMARHEAKRWAQRWKECAKANLEWGTALKRDLYAEEDENKRLRTENARLRGLLRQAFVEIDPMRENIIKEIAEALASTEETE